MGYWEMTPYSLVKNDGKDIGIAKDSLGIAIRWDEFQDWVEHVVTVSEVKDLPDYIFDLFGCSPMDVWDAQKWGTAMFGIFRTFRPGWADSDDDFAALWGIGYARKDPSLPVIRTDVDQNVVPPEDAAAALERHPEIYVWFERFFEAIGKPDELPPLLSG